MPFIESMRVLNQVVLDFIWVVYLTPRYSITILMKPDNKRPRISLPEPITILTRNSVNFLIQS
jgi:hypothetical protein